MFGVRRADHHPKSHSEQLRATALPAMHVKDVPARIVMHPAPMTVGLVLESFRRAAMDSVTGLGKQPYSRPIFRKRGREQALLFLLGHAWDGDPEAQEVLNLVFPDPSAGHSECGAVRRSHRRLHLR